MPFGNGYFFGAFLRDISARREQEAQLHAAKESAEAATRAKSEFLASMSHELRTPLNGVLGYTQLLQRDRSLNPTQREALEAIAKCGVHLLDLINDVLDLSRIEAGRVDIEPRADRSRAAHHRSQVRGRRRGSSQGTAPDDDAGARRAEARGAGRTAPAAGAAEPAGERGQVHRAGRGAAVDRGDRRRHAVLRGERHRHRHRGGGAGTDLRGLHADARRRRGRRHRAGPGHQPAPDRDDGRRAEGGEQGRPGQPLLLRAAAGAGRRRQRGGPGEGGRRRRAAARRAAGAGRGPDGAGGGRQHGESPHPGAAAAERRRAGDHRRRRAGSAPPHPRASSRRDLHGHPHVRHQRARCHARAEGGSADGRRSR